MRFLAVGAVVGGVLGWLLGLLTCGRAGPLLGEADFRLCYAYLAHPRALRLAVVGLGFGLLAWYALWAFCQVGLFRPLPPARTRTEGLRRFITSSWFWTLGLAPLGWLSEVSSPATSAGLWTLGAGVLLGLWWLAGRRPGPGAFVWLAFVVAVQMDLSKVPMVPPQLVLGRLGPLGLLLLSSAYGAVVGLACGLLTLAMSPHASRPVPHTLLAALVLAGLVVLSSGPVPGVDSMPDAALRKAIEAGPGHILEARELWERNPAPELLTGLVVEKAALQGR